ncbi:unnamed protein product [Eruca vesicaria subsp. sativa]|uniref:Uncharacterized protein n=1 Tax=Eruca vesicaria subsp. sativa TaxID=29727 RepID=A0ABC8JPR5_ERUVS|nr:unnamed protein product [Eruca vesicaria subsp. sativa]
MVKKNYGDPSDNKDFITQFRGAAVAISSVASDEKIALLGDIQSFLKDLRILATCCYI